MLQAFILFKMSLLAVIENGVLLNKLFLFEIGRFGKLIYIVKIPVDP